MSSRIVCLHVGTHKTGTKALQVFLSMNRDALEGSGIHLARAGRMAMGPGAFTPGHHALAWELLHEPHGKSFAELREEIAAVGAPVVLASSEDLHPLHARPDALRLLSEGFASLGYRTTAAIYLRPQASYAQSLYAEYAKGGFVDSFERFVETILEAGRFTSAGSKVTIAFDYAELVAALAAGISSDGVIVRRYEGSREPEYLLRDFLRVLAHLRGGLELRELRNPMAVANPSPSFRGLLETIYERATQRHGAAPDPSPARLLAAHGFGEDAAGERFSLLARDDVARFIERFEETNRRIDELSGIGLAAAARADLLSPNDPHWERAAAQRAVLAEAVRAWGVASAP